MIPLFATRPQLEELIPRIAERQRAVLDSGQYILGPETAAFEGEFAEYIGADHCVGVGNGTDAIAIALRALGVEPGDEVVVPGLTFYATAEAVADIGAVPVFCDVDPDTYVMTRATAEPLVTEKTKALVPVHLFGNVAPMEELNALASERDLVVMEDAAQAAGARLDGQRAGSLGDAATFSFYPGKNLGATGDGGAITTSHESVAERCRELRFHGSKDKVVHTDVGYNSRLDSLQAAGLRVVLAELERFTQARRAVAATYEELGLGEHVKIPVATAGADHCFHLYEVTTEDRDGLSAHLKEQGVGSRGYYTVPMHKQPAMEPYANGALPESERVGATNLALPMGTDLSREQIQRVVEAVASFA
ncbi:MAG: DegT/DnrJ/EryC1/StrS family aminotransferase [Thermoleophilaceae bacterium]|nr:DegT/DnrJ/EryC1/StrS family aminotransferase [Thermoleophilaceae bacterium]